MTGARATLSTVFSVPAVFALLAAGAVAQEAPIRLTTEYAADFEIESNDVLVAGRVYAAPGKERREMAGPAGPLVIIMRHDRGVVWTLMPANQSYVESADVLGPDVPGVTLPGGTFERLDDDEIEGHRATKFRVPPDDPAFGDESYVWLTADGVPVQIESRLRRNGREIDVEMTLKNLWLGRLDPGLFEIPPGYRLVVAPPPPPLPPPEPPSD